MRSKAMTALALITVVGGLSYAGIMDQAQARSRDRQGYSRSNNNYRSGSWNRSGMRVPAGTPIDVRLETKISTEHAESGDSWSGTIARSVVVNGRTVIPAGSPVTGVVDNSSQGTHERRPEIDLSLRRVNVNGESLALNAETPAIVADSKRAKKVGAIVGGAAAGALLGHAVGDTKGSVIGGVLGGAAGYGLTRHALRTMQLKPGTVITFTTREDQVARR